MKKLLGLLILVFCICLPQFGTSQLTKEQRLTFVQNFENVRKDLLEGDQEGLRSISIMLDVFGKLVGDREEALELLIDLQYNSKFLEIDHSDWYYEGETDRITNSINEFITKEIYDLIGEYSLLISFIDDGFFDSKYPHSLRVREVTEEFDFYRLQENETIAEIGAGRGIFSFLLRMLDMNLNIIVNELEPKLLLHSQELLRRFPLLNNKVVFVEGSKKDVNISEKVDKIIIRNTFHHFKKKKHMLRSICNSLNDDGILYIREKPHVKGNRRYCNKQMKESAIRKQIRKSQFKIIDELWINGWLHLKCVKKVS